MQLENRVLIDEDTQHGRYLTFTLADESFGIEIRYVKEIVGLQPITLIPEAPDHVKGIINLRGGIIPVIDMRLMFGREQAGYTERTCIIVVNIDDIPVGLIVDNVAEVLLIDDCDIVPPPDSRTGAHNRYLKHIAKVGNEVKLLLDCEELFSGGEAKTLNEIGGIS